MSDDRRGIAAVLFDLDGVLIDSYDAWFHQFQQTLKHFGYDAVSESEFREHWGQSTEDDVRIFMPQRTVEEVRAYFFEHYEDYLRYLKMQPGADSILDLVKSLKLPTGCVTNSHHQIVVNTLRHFHIEDRFDTLVTADDVSIPKPGPEMILKACRDLNVLPGNTVFIGDTVTDASAAKAADCIFVGYRINAETRIENLSEFADWLESAFGIKGEC